MTYVKCCQRTKEATCCTCNINTFFLPLSLAVCLSPFLAHARTRARTHSRTHAHTHTLTTNRNTSPDNGHSGMENKQITKRTTTGHTNIRALGQPNGRAIGQCALMNGCRGNKTDELQRVPNRWGSHGVTATVADGFVTKYVFNTPLWLAIRCTAKRTLALPVVSDVLRRSLGR